MPKICLVLAAAVAAASLAASPSFCQGPDEGPAPMSFEGRVVYVDVQGAAITVKGATTMTFAVPEGTMITKDEYDIRLSDIEVGDYVKIGYYRSEKGMIGVVSVRVEYDPGKSW